MLIIHVCKCNNVSKLEICLYNECYRMNVTHFKITISVVFANIYWFSKRIDWMNSLQAIVFFYRISALEISTDFDLAGHLFLIFKIKKKFILCDWRNHKLGFVLIVVKGYIFNICRERI